MVFIFNAARADSRRALVRAHVRRRELRVWHNLPNDVRRDKRKEKKIPAKAQAKMEQEQDSVVANRDSCVRHADVDSRANAREIRRKVKGRRGSY